MPRPAGRSGWVSTSGSSKPAACRRSSATRANSACRRTRTPHAIGGASRGFLARLLQHLVLMRSRFSGLRYSTNTLPSRWSISCWTQTASRPSASNSIGSPSRSSARTVTRAGAAPCRRSPAPTGSLRRRRPSRRWSPISSGLISTSGCVSRLGDVDHDHALVHVDLRRGQADAVGGVHRLEHVVDQFGGCARRPPHRLGHRVQARIGVAEDVQSSHWTTVQWASVQRTIAVTALTRRHDDGLISLRHQGFMGRICETE